MINFIITLIYLNKAIYLKIKYSLKNKIISNKRKSIYNNLLIFFKEAFKTKLPKKQIMSLVKNDYLLFDCYIESGNVSKEIIDECKSFLNYDILDGVSDINIFFKRIVFLYPERFSEYINTFNISKSNKIDWEDLTNIIAYKLRIEDIIKYNYLLSIKSIIKHRLLSISDVKNLIENLENFSTDYFILILTHQPLINESYIDCLYKINISYNFITKSDFNDYVIENLYHKTYNKELDYFIYYTFYPHTTIFNPITDNIISLISNISNFGVYIYRVAIKKDKVLSSNKYLGSLQEYPIIIKSIFINNELNIYKL